MALVVEDGTIVDGANTYASQADVDAYHAAMGNKAWAGTGRGAAILRGMAYLENLRWNGRKKTREQPLSWPRIGMYDSDGYSIPQDEVPSEVVTALCEAALVELQEQGSLRTPIKNGGQVTSLKVDGVFAETYQPGVGDTIYRSVLGKLRGLVAGHGTIHVRLA